jgi:hypothetical protein
VHNAVILTDVGAADALALEYDSIMSEVIAFAKTCSDEDWGTACPNEQRTVGVVFDHIATGNPQVVVWIREFLDDRPVEITPEILNARNAEHARRVAARPRVETIDDLVSGSRATSEYMRGLSDEQLGVVQEFGWAGPKDAGWVAGAALRHPRNHLKSIREALGR